MLVSLVITCLLALSMGSLVYADEFEHLNNMAVLNNALSLSYMTTTFFGCHLDPLPMAVSMECDTLVTSPLVKFSVSDFIVAGYNESVFNAITEIAGQQSQQIDNLFFLVEQLNGEDNEIYPACTYTFANTTMLEDFLGNGLQLATHMVAFYNGATNSAVNSTLQSGVQVLASAQARHAAYLSHLLSQHVSPASGFDMALQISAIAGSVAPYMAQCSTPPFVTQTIRPYGVAYGGDGVTRHTGPRAQSAGVVYTENQRQSDIAALEFVLLLEDIQQALYLNLSSEGLNADALSTAGFKSSVVRPMMERSASDSVAHSEKLKEMIRRLDGQTTSCSFNFGFEETWVRHSPQFALGLMYTINSLSLWTYNSLAGVMVDTDVQRSMAIIATVKARYNTMFALFANGYTGWSYDGNQLAGLPDALGDVALPIHVRAILESTVGIASSCGNELSSSTGPFARPSSSGAGNPGNGSSTGVDIENPDGTSSSGVNGAAPSSSLALSAFALSTAFFMLF